MNIDSNQEENVKESFLRIKEKLQVLKEIEKNNELLLKEKESSCSQIKILSSRITEIEQILKDEVFL